MPATKLRTHRVAKPWGRRNLFPGFAGPAPGEEPIGEIWFQAPPGADPDLLIKYLFTAEKLSVQVHPDDRRARDQGLARGKDECWVILAAEPGAKIALGPKQPMTAEELRRAAEDGSIEDKLDWKAVKAGDFFYSASGTVHAIGAGITLIEVQQNSDTTYRLYDYGRARELHLERGIEAADLRPYEPVRPPCEVEPGRLVLVEGPKFVLERWSRGGDLSLPQGVTALLIPISGRGEVAGVPFEAGECVMIAGSEKVQTGEAVDLLLAYSGSRLS
jgi:mannose-6-phosphate isomerase